MNFVKNLRVFERRPFFCVGKRFRVVSLRLGLKHSCPWPRKGLSSEGVSLALDFLCTWPRALGPRLPEVEVESRTQGSRIGQGHKKIQGHGQGQPFRGKTVSRPMTGMLETIAKDQEHRRKCSQKQGLQNFFQAVYKNLTIQKIEMSSSRGLDLRGQGRGLQNCVLEAKYVLKDSTSAAHH